LFLIVSLVTADFQFLIPMRFVTTWTSVPSDKSHVQTIHFRKVKYYVNIQQVVI